MAVENSGCRVPLVDNRNRNSVAVGVLALLGAGMPVEGAVSYLAGGAAAPAPLCSACLAVSSMNAMNFS